MKWLVFIFLLSAALPRALRGADAEGCADLKLFPRLEACTIVECSARHHDSFDTGDSHSGPLDADTNSLSYSCPLRDLLKMARDFDAQLRKAGYLNITMDRSDNGPSTITGHKGSQWVHWSASSEDSATSYSLTTASTATQKLEACAGPSLPALKTPLQQCEISECSSKSEDSIGMRTSQNQDTPLTGNVQTLALACPALPFDALQRELRTSGFEILFSNGANAITARSGKRWLELASAPDGESTSYSLTMIPSAEELTPENTEPPAIPVLAPDPTPPAAVIALVPPAPPTAPPMPPDDVPAPAAPAPTQPTQPYQPVFEYPKPILQVPIEPTPERLKSVHGDVVIHLLVDISEEGIVTKATLTGHVSWDVFKLENAAMDAVSRWRFEPARQDGRVVACVKIPVEIHFRGRPGIFAK